MTKTVLQRNPIVTKLRQMLPLKSATAHTIAMWERADQEIIDDGAREFDDDLVKLIEDCAQRGGGYRVTD